MGGGRGTWGGGGGNDVDERNRNGGEKGWRQQQHNEGVSEGRGISLKPGSTLLQALGARLGVSEEVIRSRQKQKDDPGWVEISSML